MSALSSQVDGSFEDAVVCASQPQEDAPGLGYNQTLKTLTRNTTFALH